MPYHNSSQQVTHQNSTVTTTCDSRLDAELTSNSSTWN